MKKHLVRLHNVGIVAAVMLMAGCFGSVIIDAAVDLSRGKVHTYYLVGDLVRMNSYWCVACMVLFMYVLIQLLWHVVKLTVYNWDC